VPTYERLAPLLFRLDPERAHALGKRALAAVAAVPPLDARWRRRHRVDDPRLAQTLLGRRFPNPVGLAAGFDKDAEVVRAMPALGFGFVEVGTVTPEPQAGNPRPRLFRFPGAATLQNRLGFNNRGMAALADRLDRLDRLDRRGRLELPLGVNLGKNGATPPEQALDDYARLLAAFGPRADYLVVNVSSPNTPGLRDLQSREFLAAVLGAARAATDRPVLVKLDPDLDPARAVELAVAAVDAGAAGIVATNTTADLSLVPGATGGGGLSGAVLREPSYRTLRALAEALFGRTLLVSVGGIDSAAEAYRRIRAGASLVQLYTALVFHGPRLIADINRGLLDLLDADGFPTLADAVGADLAAGQPPAPRGG
jgi:dihydroorotate dehydrogenase